MRIYLVLKKFFSLESGSNREASSNRQASSCGSPQWKGDDFCDDDNNNAGCDFDGGDCCGPNVRKNFCSQCLCLADTKGSKGSTLIIFFPKKS